MKKILTTIAGLSLAVGAFAQGQVEFDNNATGEIDVTTAGNSARAVGESSQNPGGAVWHVALLYNASTVGSGVAQSAFTEVADYIPSTANNIIDGAGSFEVTPGAGQSESQIVIPNTGNGTGEVVSWLGSATTWLGANGASLLGGNVTFATQGANLVEFTILNAPAAGGKVPGASINGQNGNWNGSAVLTVVPEPSTYALGALGVSALLAFRRRK